MNRHVRGLEPSPTQWVVVTIPTVPPAVPAVVHRIAAGRAVTAVWVNDLGGVTFRVGADWLHTAGLPGASAVHPRWLARPRQAVRAIGAGLRALHDGLPVAACPFDWSVPARLPALTPQQRDDLPDPPPVDKLVVCHGDACAPNTVIDGAGRCCGHVDLDQLGVADRWADLAVAALSLGWNYPGGSWDAEFFTAYGVDPDPARLDFYARLWNTG
jgi:kanamycin kinase